MASAPSEVIMKKHYHHMSGPWVINLKLTGGSSAGQSGKGPADCAAVWCWQPPLSWMVSWLIYLLSFADSSPFHQMLISKKRNSDCCQSGCKHLTNFSALCQREQTTKIARFSPLIWTVTSKQELGRHWNCFTLVIILKMVNIKLTISNTL